MTSLRRSLLRALLPALLALLVLHGVVLYRVISYSVVRQFDESLENGMGALATLLLEGSEDGIELEFAEELMPAYGEARRDAFFELWKPDGSVLERSPSLLGKDLPQPRGRYLEPFYWDLPLPDGRPGRAIAMRLQARPWEESAEQHSDDPAEGHSWQEEAPSPIPEADAGVADVVLARSRAELDRSLRIVLLSTLAVGALLGLGCVRLVTRGVRRAVEPLDAVGVQLSAMALDESPQEILGELAPLEIQPLLRRLEELLQRVRSTLERERRTSAHIAHELRTPISELRSAVDVALRWPEDRSLTDQALIDARDIAAQMQRHVDSLLHLARQAARADDVDLPHARVGELLSQVWAGLDASAQARALRVEWRLQEIELRVDPDALEIALGNLLANAVHHTPEAGWVEIETRVDESECVLAVRNTNPGLDAQDLRRLHEAFWRRERSDGGGSGLGLELTTALVESVGGRLEFALDAGGDFVAQLIFPLEMAIIQGS